MEITEFARQLINWTDFNTTRSYPSNLTLPSSLWDRIRALREYTDTDSRSMHKRFPEYTGSLGYEHSATLAYIVDSLYISNLLPGSWTSVTTEMHIEIKHEPDGEDYVMQKRILNRQVVEKKRYKVTELLKLGKLEFGFVWHMHTHPSHFIAKEQIGYGFYSQTDLNSLMKSSLYLSGLVTDRMWLLGKTSLSKMPSQETLFKISLAEADGIDKMVQLCKEELLPLGYVLYTAKFGEQLMRIG